MLVASHNHCQAVAPWEGATYTGFLRGARKVATVQPNQVAQSSFCSFSNS